MLTDFIILQGMLFSCIVTFPTLTSPAFFMYRQCLDDHQKSKQINEYCSDVCVNVIYIIR